MNRTGSSGFILLKKKIQFAHYFGLDMYYMYVYLFACYSNIFLYKYIVFFKFELKIGF